MSSKKHDILGVEDTGIPPVYTGGVMLPRQRKDRRKARVHPVDQLKETPKINTKKPKNMWQICEDREDRSYEDREDLNIPYLSWGRGSTGT